MSNFKIEVNRDIRGGLDTNSNEQNISGGNYPDRVNIVRNNDGTFGADTPEWGTKKVYDLPVVELQNQRVRIFLDRFFTFANLEIRNVRDQVLRFSQPTSSPSLVANKQAIINVVTAWGIPAQFFNTGNDTNFIDIEIDLLYSDYTLRLWDATGDFRVRIIKEAISLTGTGQLYDIGNWQVNGLLFKCLTSQKRTMERTDDIQTLQNLSGQLVVEIPNHGLQTNESIILARLQGSAALFNGEWTVTVLSTDFFVINYAIPGANIPTTPTNFGGFIFRYPYGYSAVLCQQYDTEQDTYSYTIPLRSKRINWNTQKQVDIDAEFFNGVYSLYPTDDYNRPYVFYFNDPVFDDCGIEALNPENGRYEYEQLRLQILRHKDSNPSTVTIQEQRQSGGSLTSGSIRYGTVLRTFEGSATEISDLSDLVRVYAPVYPSIVPGPDYVYGSYGPTTKANQVLVENIPPGIYEFIDLVAVYVTGADNNLTATEAFIISSTQLGPDQTSIALDHTGNEIDIRVFSLQQLNPVRQTVLTVKTNRIGENRLFEANYTTTARVDLRDFAATLQYGIRKFPLFSDFGGENYYGFAKPFVSQVGYQIYEWYRFYAVFEFIEGGESDATFAFDARLVTQQEYTDSFGTSDDYRFLDTNVTDRRNFAIDDFTTYDLGDADRNLFQFYFQVSVPDWNFQIEGRPAKDVIKRIKICRVERIPEVQSMGYIRSSTNVDLTLEFFAEDWSLGGFLAGGNLNNPEQRLASYYAPDVLFGITSGDIIQGDTIIVTGAPDEVILNNTTSSPWTLDGRRQVFAPQNFPVSVPFKYTVQQAFFIGEGGSAIFNDNGTPIGFTKAEYVFQPTFSNLNVKGKSIGSPVLLVQGTGFTSPGGFPRSALFAIHYRRITNKYGLITSPVDVLFTGYSITPDQNVADVFGGDVYTQQTWVRPIFPNTGGSSTGNALGLNIISQNRLNTQMRVYDPTNTTNLLYPFSAGGFSAWIDSPNNEQTAKNAAYQEIKNQQYLPVFDPNALDRNEFRSRIRYSENKPNGSVKDFYTIFPPANFRDNPLNFGAIELLDLKQGELFTLQELCYTREFVNNQGRLATIEDGTISIGDASVLAREGIRLTQLGSKHRWSYARGLTDAGNDVRAWLNSDFFCILRNGNDGTVNLTVRTMMDTFMRKRMRYVSNKYTPADGQGIHATWDNRSKNFVFTARGWKNVGGWNLGRTYPVGEEVIFGETYGIPQIYVCKEANTASALTQPGTVTGTQFWTAIELSNTNYYSVWTLCFNEQFNKFTEFHTYYPRIYANHFDRVLAQNPREGFGNEMHLFREDEENPLVFFGEEHEGYTEYVINVEEDMNKKFVAIRHTSLYPPHRVNMKTQFIGYGGIENRETELVASEFTPRENGFYSAIKMTLDEQGRNDRKTKDMRGLWLRIKTFFKAREKQQINNIFVSARFGQRNVNNP
jgi:hypothetical protein